MSKRTYLAADLGIDMDRLAEGRHGGWMRRDGRRVRLIRQARARHSDRRDVAALPDDADDWTHVSAITYVTPAVESAVRRGEADCPACGRRRMRAYQLAGRSGQVPDGDRGMSSWTLCECGRCGCDARLPTLPDGLPQWPAVPVGAALREDWPLDQDAPKFAPDQALKGGKGGPRK